MNRIGGDGGTDFAARAIKPSLWDQFVGSAIGEDAHGYIIVIRINHLEVQLHNIRARTLSNPVNHGLGNGIVIGLHLRPESTPVQITP